MISSLCQCEYNPTNNLGILIIFHLLDYNKWTKSRKKLHENYSHISKYPFNVYLWMVMPWKFLFNAPYSVIVCEKESHRTQWMCICMCVRELQEVNCNIVSALAATHWSMAVGSSRIQSLSLPHFASLYENEKSIRRTKDEAKMNCDCHHKQKQAYKCHGHNHLMRWNDKEKLLFVAQLVYVWCKCHLDHIHYEP